MNHIDTIGAILERRIIAVIRLTDPSPLPRIAEALLEGGVTLLEITLTTPGAAEAIQQLTSEMPESIIVGAGSVLTTVQARACIDAGAAFIVSPVFQADIVHLCRESGTVVIPGAYTPTEIHTAHESGADFVKVFPADRLGPGFIKSVLAPMPLLRLIPTGGVTLANAESWFAAGAVAVGIGSDLVPSTTRTSDDIAAVGRVARRLVETTSAAKK